MLKVHLVYGFVSQNPVLLFLYTELNQWMNHEKKVLTEIAKQHGIEWEQKGTHEEHLDVYNFKKKERKKEVQELEQEKEYLTAENEELTAQIAESRADIQILKDDKEQAIREKQEAEPTYGKYGMLRKQFLKEHRSARYQYLLLTGKLNEHLNQTDQEAREQVEMLMKQMAEKKGVTEELKVQDQMKWVGLMNNIKVSAEEIILKNMVYV